MLRNAKHLLVRLALIIVVIPGYIGAQEIEFFEEDWEYIPHKAPITSASDGIDWLLFSTLDGLLGYDNVREQLVPMGQLNTGLPSRKLYQVFQDPQTEAIWVVHDRGISYRHNTDIVWRRVSSSVLPDYFSGLSVTGMASNEEGIWVDSDGLFTVIDRIGGELLKRGLQPPMGDVTWNTNRFDFAIPPTYTEWFGDDEWLVAITNFIGPGDLIAEPQFQIRDKNQHLWVVTDIGYLFKGDPFTLRMEEVKIGIAPLPVTTALLDRDKFWFAQSHELLKLSDPGRSDATFLSSWDERGNRWQTYAGVESESIRSTGINRILRVGREIWLATNEGLLVLKSRSGQWSSYGTTAGLSSKVILDMVLHKGRVYLATERGVNIMHPRKHTFFPQPVSGLPPNARVHDLSALNDRLIAGTSQGIFEYKRKPVEGWAHISHLPATEVTLSDDQAFASVGTQFFQEMKEFKTFDLVSFPIQIEGKIVGLVRFEQYIWLATTRGAILYDQKGDQHTAFKVRNGLPSGRIFQIIIDENWAWFFTRGGLSRFKWTSYFD